MKTAALRPRTNLRLLFLLCLCCITILSIVPDDVERGRDIPKLTTSGFFIHVAAYWVTSLLGVFAFEKSFTTILVILLMHGFFIELVQFFIPYRSFNLLDILANIVGVLAALLLFVFIQLRK